MEELESIERESNVLEKLKNLYKSKVKNIERKYNLYNFSLPRGGEIQDAEFGSLPMVLLIGQYSTGKTTFIRHLLRTDFPGMHIGPEPTSDKFMAMLYSSDDDKEVDDVGSSGAAVNEDETNVPDDSHEKENVEKSDYIMSDDEKTQNGKLIQGNTLTVMPDLPFSSLSSFGDKFLNHFQGSECSASILRDMIFIDTPGVLSGEKQRISRSYDFGKAVKWFADRSDLILLLFDSHKLDISDELKEVISTIMPHNDDKIRCILNKADKEKKDQFVRVYGSLTWSIGKILQTPEVVRIFTGSYWDKPFENKDFAEMFHADEKLLISELKTLPSMRTQRLVNELVKRIRLVKVYICLLANIRSRMPRLFGHKAAQEKILQDLRPIFDEVQRKYNLSVGDMPDDLSKFQESLCSAYASFSNIPDLDKDALQTLDDLLEKEIPQLMKDYTASKSRSNRHNKTTTKIDIPITSLKRGADEMMNKQQNNVGRGSKKLLLIIIFIAMILFAIPIALQFYLGVDIFGIAMKNWKATYQPILMDLCWKLYSLLCGITITLRDVFLGLYWKVYSLICDVISKARNGMRQGDFEALTTKVHSAMESITSSSGNESTESEETVAVVDEFEQS